MKTEIKFIIGVFSFLVILGICIMSFFIGHYRSENILLQKENKRLIALTIIANENIYTQSQIIRESNFLLRIENIKDQIKKEKEHKKWKEWKE